MAAYQPKRGVVPGGIAAATGTPYGAAYLNSARYQQVLQQTQAAAGLLGPTGKLPRGAAKYALPAGLGEPVQRKASANLPVPADLVGKYLGLGTYANTGAFNNKVKVLITPEWAQALTQEYQARLGALGAAQGNPEFSIGLAGTRDDGSVGLYVPSLYGSDDPAAGHYFADDRARLSVGNGNPASGAPNFVLPGSSESHAALQAGYPIGLVTVKNPYVETGYPAVGSKKYLDTIAKFANGYEEDKGVSEGDIQHLIGQGAVYGLGRVYSAFNIPIVAQSAPGGITRFQFAPGSGWDASRFAQSHALMQAINDEYSTYLVDPDKRKLGSYGAASLFVRHADKMTGLGANFAQGDMQAVNALVPKAFAAKGSARGLVQWAGRYRDFNNRRGLTAFPLRDAAGNPVAYATQPNAGRCTLVGSGPGVSANARKGGEFGLRLYNNASKRYVRTGRGLQGSEIVADRTYHCGFTPDYVVNPLRANMYGPGGARAFNGQSLAQSLEEIAAANQGATWLASRDIAGQSMDARTLATKYDYFNAHPTEFGANPWYFAKTARGNRFAKFAPILTEAYADPRQRRIIENADLTQAVKIQQSNALLGRLQAGQPVAGYQAVQARVPQGAVFPKRARKVAKRGALFAPVYAGAVGGPQGM